MLQRLLKGVETLLGPVELTRQIHLREESIVENIVKQGDVAMANLLSALSRSGSETGDLRHIQIGRAVDAQAMHSVIVGKDGLRAIAVMNVPVNDQHPGEAEGLGIPGCSGQGVQQTVTVTPIPVRCPPKQKQKARSR
jgi:hypothetical protein